MKLNKSEAMPIKQIQERITGQKKKMPSLTLAILYMTFTKLFLDQLLLCKCLK